MDMNMTNSTSMDMSAMMPMPMFVYWTADTWFLFGTWHTKEDQHGMFGLGCFLSFVFNVVMFLCPAIQKKFFSASKGGATGDTCHNTDYMEINEKQGRRGGKTMKDVFVGLVFFFIMFVMSCINMLLLMTFNGWLIISIIVGACVGYLGGEIMNLQKS